MRVPTASRSRSVARASKMAASAPIPVAPESGSVWEATAVGTGYEGAASLESRPNWHGLHPGQPCLRQRLLDPNRRGRADWPNSRSRIAGCHQQHQQQQSCASRQQPGKHTSPLCRFLRVHGISFPTRRLNLTRPSSCSMKTMWPLYIASITLSIRENTYLTIRSRGKMRSLLPRAVNRVPPR